MVNKKHKGDVCSHSHSFFLDNYIRRLFQNPYKIVGEYIHKGDVVIDLGCGPGFFSIEMAKMVGRKGKIFSIDLQKEMLEKLKDKAVKRRLMQQIILHNCSQDTIGLKGDIKADFILAFYMVHETLDHEKFLREAKAFLKTGGKFLIVEPFFHVSKRRFKEITQCVKNIGFTFLGSPSKKGGRSLLLTVPPQF